MLRMLALWPSDKQTDFVPPTLYLTLAFTLAVTLTPAQALTLALTTAPASPPLPLAQAFHRMDANSTSYTII